MADKKYKLLVVDDDEKDRAKIIGALEEYFAIDQAANLIDATKLIRTRYYDIVITDGIFSRSGNHKVIHPTDDDRNGVRIVREAQKKNIYVIGMSSDPKLFGNKPNATFQKPVNISELQTIIKNHLKIQ